MWKNSSTIIFALLKNIGGQIEKMNRYDNRKMSEISIAHEQNSSVKCPHCGAIIRIKPRTREALKHIEECKPILEDRKSINLPFIAHVRLLQCHRCRGQFFVADLHSFIHEDLVSQLNL